MLNGIRSRSVEKIFIDFDPMEFIDNEKDALSLIEEMEIPKELEIDVFKKMDVDNIEKIVKTDELDIVKKEFARCDSDCDDNFDYGMTGELSIQDESSSEDDLSAKSEINCDSEEEQHEEMLCNICGEIFRKKVRYVF